MKQIFALLPLLVIFLSCHSQVADSMDYKNGDIIFQDFNSGLNTPIKLITESDYSHVGFLIKKEGKWMIYEAVQPVRLAEFDEWVSRHPDKKYVVKRHQNADSLINDSTQVLIDAFIKKHINKNYDIKFAWTDKDMYCSELVWKMYKEVLNVEVGKQQQLQDLNASHPIVKAKLKELFGDQIPWQETVLSPQAIFECEDLKTIYSN